MREWNFHSHSQKLGMEFFCSCFQKLGMNFFISFPVPKVWEGAEPFPFPFPNDQKSFPLTPSPVLNWGRHRGSLGHRKGASENPPGQGSAKRCQRTAMKMNRNISVLLVTKMMTMTKVCNLNQCLLHLCLPHKAPLGFRAIPGYCLYQSPAVLNFFTMLSDGCWQSPHLLQSHLWPPEINILMVFTNVPNICDVVSLLPWWWQWELLLLWSCFGKLPCEQTKEPCSWTTTSSHAQSATWGTTIGNVWNHVHKYF